MYYPCDHCNNMRPLIFVFASHRTENDTPPRDGSLVARKTVTSEYNWRSMGNAREVLMTVLLGRWFETESFRD